MSVVDQYREKVRGLALLDAAYLLWVERRSFEQPALPTQPNPPLDMSNPKVFRRLVKDVFASVDNSQRTACDGPTFDRLKYLRPGIEDRYLKEAIRQAVSFDMACIANFHYNSDSYIDDCKIAVAFAAAENPGFSAKTKALAEHYLMISMR